MALRLGLIVNPTSGKNTGARIGTEAVTLLRAAGAEIVDLSAPDARGASEKGRAALAAGAVDALVVAGGDGMVHLGTNLCAGTGVPLGVVAAGTGNDIARELGLPVRDAAAAVERILAGRTRLVDAARHVMPSGEERWFVGVLAAGFDAVVNERANAMTWPRGQMRYNLATLAALRTFHPLPYTLDLDGEVLRTRAMLVAVGNGPSFGGGLRITEGASFEDGLLDVVVIGPMSRAGLVRTYPKLFRGTHVHHPQYSRYRVRRVTVAAPGITAYADGERLGALPLTVEADPGALTVLA